MARQDPREKGSVIVDAMDPRLMVDVTGEPGLPKLADEVAGMLETALREVTAG